MTEPSVEMMTVEEAKAVLKCSTVKLYSLADEWRVHRAKGKKGKPIYDAENIRALALVLGRRQIPPEAAAQVLHVTEQCMEANIAAGVVPAKGTAQRRWLSIETVKMLGDVRALLYTPNAKLLPEEAAFALGIPVRDVVERVQSRKLRAMNIAVNPKTDRPMYRIYNDALKPELDKRLARVGLK